jgi:hypothetical protein
MATTNLAVSLTNEGTPGTIQAINGAHAVECSRCDFTPVGSPIRRGVLSGRMDWRKPATPHGRYWQIDLEGEVKAQTAAATAGELQYMLQAAGFTQTVGATVVYTLQAEPNGAAVYKSLTVYLEEGLDGNIYKGHGFRPGNLSFSFGIDRALTWSCSGPAGYNVPAAIGANTALTLHAGTPLVYLAEAAPFTTHAYAAILRGGTINVGLDATARPHMGGTAANGYHRWPSVLSRGADSHVSFSFEIESVDETAFALYTKWAAGTHADTTLKFEAGSRSLLFTLNDSVFDPPTRSAGNPNVFNLSGTASYDGTDGAIVLTFA